MERLTARPAPRSRSNRLIRNGDWRAMLRTKLVVAFLGLLGPAVLMSALLYWGPRQMEQRLERALLAHDEVQAYLALALHTNRHLQQLEYEVTLGHAANQDDLSASRDRLTQMLVDLRRLTLQELAFVGDAEPEEQQELERIARFENLLDQALTAISRAGAGGSPEILRRDMGLLDQRLGALIDEVIADESREAEVADAQARQLTARLTVLAIVVVALSAICALITALWARRRIQAPVDALIEGTRTIARGRLDHRVSVSGRDELANLAVSFNWMVAEVERRRAELDRTRADLEREVQDRTRELRQSNQTLRRVDEARRRMFADISHALRTPLTVIRGEAEVTLRGRDGKSRGYRGALQRIVATTAQLNKLVEDLLQVARSESATLHAEPSDILANRLVAEVAEDAKALAAAKGIRVACVAPAGAIQIRGDTDRLRQLLLILVDNACRYTPADGQISIGLGTSERYAVVTVSDSGIGIPADEVDLVPGRFYRGSNVTDLAPSGAGLGLHVAQSIAEAHAGDIAVDSEPGRGTTVRVRLPLWEGADAIDERAAG
jgi:two-component system OmpR family sensor kinase